MYILYYYTIYYTCNNASCYFIDPLIFHNRIGSDSEFQLDLFMRVRRPVRTGLRPALFTRALPEFNKKIIKKKKKNYFLFLQNVIAVFVFSDNRCKNACKMLADLCPCFHQSPTIPNFGGSRVKDLVSFAH